MDKASEYYERGCQYDQKKDYVQASICYAIAAELGDARAQNSLGCYYLNGTGVEENRKTAAEWFQKSAGQDHMYAFYNLGLCYEYGWGVKKDPVQSFQHYLRSAELGHVKGQCETGLCYRYGIGVGKDFEKGFQYLFKSAEQGYAKAQYEVGLCYENGYGVGKDLQKAFVYYLQSAENGYAKAQNDAGVCYLDGIGVERDSAKAREWFEKAAGQDNEYGWYNLGRCYEYGYSVKKDPSEAFRYYLKSAELGHTKAQDKVGIFYLNGWGTEKSLESAFSWFQKSAEQGNMYGSYDLGRCYASGLGVGKDLKIAFQCYSKAAKQGHSDAQNEVGRFYLNGWGVEKDLAKAFAWLQKSAGQNNKYGCYNLGRCHEFAWGTKKDLGKAFSCYLKSAEQGHPGAQYEAGVCYAYGKGTEEDLKKAFHYYSLGARNGNSKAQNSLGNCYFNGSGTERDDGKALEWFRKAAKNGHVLAHYNLGLCYEKGRGVEADPKKAFQCYLKAAEMGDGDSQNKVGIFYLGGTGTPQDEGKAVEWFLKAYTTEKNRYAAYNLGLCYERGLGVETDKRRALDYYEKAAALGHESAQKKAEQLRQELGEELPPKSSQKRNPPAAPEKKQEEEPRDTRSAMERLESLIGLDSVKEEVRKMARLQRLNAKREKMGMKPSPVSMHMVFTGNPGTGKTTVARLIGELYHEIGLLPNGTVKEVKRGDLVAEYIGQTAVKTQEVIDGALGGILFIDEAYTLSPEEKGRDFGQEAIDTLLAAMEEHRKDLAVIVAGYDQEMQRFIESNPGLKSRFKTFIHFEDYNAGQLYEIFCQMAGGYGYRLSDSAEEPLREYFEGLYRTRGADFGNGRDVRNFYEAVLVANANRLSGLEDEALVPEALSLLTGDDIRAAMEEKSGKRQEEGQLSVLERLDSMTGLERVKEEVLSLQQLARYYQYCQQQHLPTMLPAMHMVFTGNPGTGKTTIARMIGEIYHQLGLLPRETVTVVKRENLVGEHVGKTAPKTSKVIQRALGGVLFIDEAYTLRPKGSQNDFGQEAIDTLLAAMEENRTNLVVIVAGYDGEMGRFINSNPGLKSRFTKYIHFDDYDGAELFQIFRSFAKERSFTFGEGAEAEAERVCREMYEQRGESFGNARDVRNFFEDVTISLAVRVATSVSQPTREDLTRILREDILEAERKRKQNQMFHEDDDKKNPIGFHE